MYTAASGQDWTPVVFHKRTADDVAKVTEVQRKRTTNQSKTAVADVDTYKLLKEDEVVKHESVSTELRTSITKAHLAAKLTQAQLAQRINELPKVVQEYENGKAIPNNAILQKMSKVLGVVLKKKPDKKPEPSAKKV